MTFVLKIISYICGGIVTIKIHSNVSCILTSCEEPWQLFLGRAGCVFLFTDCKPSGAKYRFFKKSKSDLKEISYKMQCCIVAHNVCVFPRILM